MGEWLENFEDCKVRPWECLLGDRVYVQSKFVTMFNAGVVYTLTGGTTYFSAQADVQVQLYTLEYF